MSTDGKKKKESKIVSIVGFSIVILVVIGVIIVVNLPHLLPVYDKAATERRQELLLERQIEVLERIAVALEKGNEQY